jgi:hypothetical protein
VAAGDVELLVAVAAAGFKREEEEVLVFAEEQPLSMMAVANEAGFFPANLLPSAVGGCPAWASTLPPFPVDADADADADAVPDPEPDPDSLGLFVAHAFLAALPRTSPTSSAADFFFVLSSSEDRLEDMMVSRVPYAALLRRLPFLLLGWDWAEFSSSEVMACSVGPPELCP